MQCYYSTVLQQCICEYFHINGPFFATTAAIPTILDANNGLSGWSDMMVASVASRSPGEKFELPKKKNAAVLCYRQDK